MRYRSGGEEEEEQIKSERKIWGRRRRKWINWLIPVPTVPGLNEQKYDEVFCRSKRIWPITHTLTP